MERKRPPTDRAGITHKIVILAMDDDGVVRDVELFMTANTYPDGKVCEIFLTCDKEGSLVAGLLDVVATQTSMLLQSGWSLEKLVDKFAHSKFAPMGHTKGDTKIKYAKSIIDYIFRWLGSTFCNIPADPEGCFCAYQEREAAL